MSTPPTMTSRPGHITLAATELIYGHGARSGIAPQDFQDYLRAHEGVKGLLSRPWCDRVYVPAVTHLLLPRIAVPVTVTYPQIGNPIRISHIHGKTVFAMSKEDAEAVLAPYTVAISHSAAASLWSWLNWLTHRGLPEDIATLALAAGMSEEETLSAYNRGALDRETLVLMHALSETSHPDATTGVAR